MYEGTRFLELALNLPPRYDNFSPVVPDRMYMVRNLDTKVGLK
jgi:hypothetical protein